MNGISLGAIVYLLRLLNRRLEATFLFKKLILRLYVGRKVVNLPKIAAYYPHV